MKLTKHYVTFLSPGTFFAEETTKEIPSWDVDLAVQMARGIKERHAATPYGFYFTTRERDDDDFDSKQTKKSGMYFLGGDILTLETLKILNRKEDEILIRNMEVNKWNRVVINDNSWRWTQPLTDEDIVLDYVQEK